MTFYIFLTNGNKTYQKEINNTTIFGDLRKIIMDVYSLKRNTFYLTHCNNLLSNVENRIDILSYNNNTINTKINKNSTIKINIRAF